MTLLDDMFEEFQQMKAEIKKIRPLADRLAEYDKIIIAREATIKQLEAEVSDLRGQLIHAAHQEPDFVLGIDCGDIDLVDLKKTVAIAEVMLRQRAFVEKQEKKEIDARKRQDEEFSA